MAPTLAEGMDLCLGDSDVKAEPKPLMDGTTITATAPWPLVVYSSHFVRINRVDQGLSLVVSGCFLDKLMLLMLLN